MGHYIKITTFESPHKFWFMDEDDSDKCKELQTSINNKILEDLIQVTPFKSMVSECSRDDNERYLTIVNYRNVSYSINQVLSVPQSRI